VVELGYVKICVFQLGSCLICTNLDAERKAMTNNKDKRIRLLVGDGQYQRLVLFANKSGRSKSDVVRLIILNSTKNLTDFSIVDNTDFSNINSGPRYQTIESTLPSISDVEIIEKAAADRQRNITSFVYSIAAAATKGFNDYSVVNESYTSSGQ